MRDPFRNQYLGWEPALVLLAIASTGLGSLWTLVRLTKHCYRHTLGRACYEIAIADLLADHPKELTYAEVCDQLRFHQPGFDQELFELAMRHMIAAGVIAARLPRVDEPGALRLPPGWSKPNRPPREAARSIIFARLRLRDPIAA